jgi:hypothetical protein
MQEFLLRGIAEGVTGVSSISAKNLEDVFTQKPILEAVRHKLSINGNEIGGYAACDG